MEELIKIFQNYKDETDENREKAILGAIKILVTLNDDRKTMKEQIARTNREMKRRAKAIISTKQILINYIDLIEESLKE